jgi:hypothetical protein
LKRAVWDEKNLDLGSTTTDAAGETLLPETKQARRRSLFPKAKQPRPSEPIPGGKAETVAETIGFGEAENRAEMISSGTHGYNSETNCLWRFPAQSTPWEEVENVSDTIHWEPGKRSQKQFLREGRPRCDKATRCEGEEKAAATNPCDEAAENGLLRRRGKPR